VLTGPINCNDALGFCLSRAYHANETDIDVIGDECMGTRIPRCSQEPPAEPADDGCCPTARVGEKRGLYCLRPFAITPSAWDRGGSVTSMRKPHPSK
jgi:hypothetical protein